MKPHRCPRCNRPTIEQSGYRYCTACKALWDEEDDGDYSDRDPSARLEREEREAGKRHKHGRH